MAAVPGFDGAVDQDKIISMTVHKTHAMPRSSGSVVESRFVESRWVWHGMALVMVAALSGCGTQPVARVDSHLRNDGKSAAPGGEAATQPPPPVRQVPLPPPPQPRVEELTYSTSLVDVPVQEVLDAISLQTKVNIDVRGKIEGRITLNAINQTLKQILTRISKMVDMRFEFDGPNLVVMPDTPYLKIYRVDYVNMGRDAEGTIGVQTQVVGPAGVAGAGGSTGAQNSSIVKLTNKSGNHFWDVLEKNIKEILQPDKTKAEPGSENANRNASAPTPAPVPAAAAARAPGSTDAPTPANEATNSGTNRVSVFVNAETGVIGVRATSRQHERVSEFIEQISGSSRRQVLIEATVVEVLLNDNYQSGVDWSSLGLNGLGYTIKQSVTPLNLTSINQTNIPDPTNSGLTSPFVSIGYSNPNAAAGGSISSVTKLLSSYGTAKVLSSPKIMTLNNQTAVMKVVENQVYFVVQSTVTPASVAGGQPTISYNTTPNVVPEGFVMNVTPQISDKDVINLNIRPSVTRISSFVSDPNPDLAKAGVVNRIPVIQTREFESMLRLASGQTAMMGGLMQDSFANARDGLPLFSRLPVFGDLTSYRNDTGKKSEFVVFLRATVIREASLDSDMAEFRNLLPDAQFFRDPNPSIDIRNPKSFMSPISPVPDAEPKKAP